MANKTDAAEIMLGEYQCLRTEIITKMQACWQILTFETGGTSIILGFVFADGQYVLLPLIPFLILVSSFIHMGETMAILNVGKYFRERVEPSFKKYLQGSTAMSWEQFLYDNRGGRWGPYKVIHSSAIILFGGMFWASMALTVVFRKQIGISSISDWIFLAVLFLAYAVAFAIGAKTWYERVYKAQ